MSSTKLQDRISINRWELKEVDGLQLTFSVLLSQFKELTHAFTTRRGGATPHPYDDFNLGRHIEDESLRRDAIANRTRLCDVLGLNHDNLTVPGQKHTTNVYKVNADTPGGQQLPDFDAVVTAVADKPMLLHFADCVPIMLYDPVAKALSVIHAGWRGTAGGIAIEALRKLKEEYGCNAANIHAAIGPAIGPCCYQTGEDVAAKLSETVKSSLEHSTEGSIIQWRQGSPYPDLKLINGLQLAENGVLHIDVTQWCTACHPQVFYSHRQSGGITGRQGAIASMTT